MSNFCQRIKNLAFHPLVDILRVMDRVFGQAAQWEALSLIPRGWLNKLLLFKKIGDLDDCIPIAV